MNACLMCRNRNPALRHRHYLEFSTEEELSAHLEDASFAGFVLQWRHEMFRLYGGMVDSRGTPLTPWQARTRYLHVYQQQYFKPHGSHGPEPATAKGRAIALAMFQALLTQSRSPYATGWLELLNHQTLPLDTDEGWNEFCLLLKDFERGIYEFDHEQPLRTVPHYEELQ